MSNAKQILAMLRSRAEGDDAQFYSIALQVAASEARQGHRDTANELRSAVDAARGAGGVKASIPVSFAALINFSNNIVISVFWKDAQISFR